MLAFCIIIHNNNNNSTHKSKNKASTVNFHVIAQEEEEEESNENENENEEDTMYYPPTDKAFEDTMVAPNVEVNEDKSSSPQANNNASNEKEIEEDIKEIEEVPETCIHSLFCFFFQFSNRTFANFFVLIFFDIFAAI